MAAEATMICIDTSDWMQSVRSRRFKKQAEAIELYCAKKLNSHQQNVVGICGMGERYILCPIKPTRDLGKIMKAIYGVHIGGCLWFKAAISFAWDTLLSSSDSHMHQRIVVFAADVVLQYKHEMEALGKVMKERNLACDVVNFGDQSENKKELLDTLIVAADNNGNCHILHVEPECSPRHALSRSLVIPQVEEGGSSIAAVDSLSTEGVNKTQKCVSEKIQQLKTDTSTQCVSLKIQQAKTDPSTQEIVKLKLEVEKKKEQIDALTKDNENLKQELELSRNDKIQVLSLIAMLYVVASKDTSTKPIPQIQWNFLPKL